MGPEPSDRRRFLKNGAALAGLAATPFRSAMGVTRTDKPEASQDYNNYGVRSQFETWARQPDYPSMPFPAKLVTPLQDLTGIITPSPLHFVANHSVPPDIDPREYSLVIHGMVEHPRIYTLEELKRLPSVSRIYFLECVGNSAPAAHGMFNPSSSRKSFETAQDIHGRVSCSEWTGVPLSVLLNEAGLQKGAAWLVSVGSDSSKYSYSLPLTKAIDDVLVAYGQNSEAVRPEQGYPLRLVVPGWQAPFSVKWLRQIEVLDEPAMTKTEITMDTTLRPNLQGKARWFNFVMPPKSVILRPSGKQRIASAGYYEITGLAWSGSGAVRRVEVSVDGGQSWRAAQLQEPVLSGALTRFRIDWSWKGEEALLMSRCTDDQGQVQPSLAELSKSWGISDMSYWHSITANTPLHFNAIQPWRIDLDGSVHNAMFS